MRVGGGDQSVAERGALADGQRAARFAPDQPRSARVTDKNFIEKRLSDRPQHRRALIAQADQGGPQGQTGDKRAGAVHRIDHPDELGVRAILAVLFADHPVVRMAGCDQRPNRRLRPAVGRGDRIEGAAGVLVLQTVIGAEQRQDNLCGRAIEVEQEGIEADEAVGGEHASGLAGSADGRKVRRTDRDCFDRLVPPIEPMAKSGVSVVRDLIWRLEAAGFDLATALIRSLPVDVASAAGGGLLRLVGPLTRAHRTAARGLRIAFPDVGEADHAALLAAQWDNFGRYIAEFPVLDRLTPASGRVEIVGAERLARIAVSRSPVIFVSGHFSNMEVMSAAILHAGIPCDITYRAANNLYVDARMKRSRFRYGVRMFAPKGADGARELMAALKAGRSVAMMNDQKYDGGVAAPFFGRTVYTLPAAARLALRFGAEIQPLSVQRTVGARFRLTVHDPIRLRDTGDRNRDIEIGVTAINGFIEARVRERPGEWWWMHRRWPKADYD